MFVLLRRITLLLLCLLVLGMARVEAQTWRVDRNYYARNVMYRATIPPFSWSDPITLPVSWEPVTINATTLTSGFRGTGSITLTHHPAVPNDFGVGEQVTYDGAHADAGGYSEHATRAPGQGVISQPMTIRAEVPLLYIGFRSVGTSAIGHVSLDVGPALNQVRVFNGSQDRSVVVTLKMVW